MRKKLRDARYVKQGKQFWSTGARMRRPDESHETRCCLLFPDEKYESQREAEDQLEKLKGQHQREKGHLERETEDLRQLVQQKQSDLTSATEDHSKRVRSMMDEVC